MSANFNDKDPLTIAFGRGHLSLSLPPEAAPTVVRKRSLPKLKDAAGTIAQALNAPIGSAPLGELARGKTSACILICDITRPVPNRLFLAADDRDPGGSRDPARSHHGAGRDGPASAQSRRGARRAGRRRLGSRQCEGREPLCPVGGGPRRLRPHARRAARRSRSTGASSQADLRIATGLVEPHFMAGWSGGRKVIAPGVAGHETIRTFHSARFMEDPLAVQCNLDRQPSARGATRDRPPPRRVATRSMLSSTRIATSFASTFGEVIASHQAAVDFVAEIHARAGRPAIQDLGHLLRRVSAGQDLLPDGQRHGDADRHSRARRHFDHRLGMFGRLRIERVPRGAAPPHQASGRRGFLRR